MAETLLDYEVGVLTMTPRRARNSNPESEIEDENDWSDMEWTDIRDRKRQLYNAIPYAGENICDYSSYEIYEAFDYMAENEGDISDVSFDDIDSYLYDRGERLGDYDSVQDLARYTADWKISQDLNNSRYEILKYYAYCYYADNFGNMMPEGLKAEIEEYDYYQMDRVDDVDDLINEWIDDHEGIMDYMP